MPSLDTHNRESLLVLDSGSFHKTNDVKQVLRDNLILPAVIHPGCQGIVEGPPGADPGDGGGR